MSDPLDQKREELLDYHNANGCINVRKLIDGTRLLIRTLDEVYELEVGTAKFGVVLLASNGRFEDRDKAIVTGSLDPKTKIFIPEIIGEGLRIIFRSQKGQVIRTQPVTSARIAGATYVYELWEKLCLTE